MANFKELKTKILLKQQTYAEWTANTDTGANYIPLYGEVCFCEIPASPATGSAEATTAPTVLFKVGTAKKNPDGSYVTGTDKKFSELKWASALAADVYAWAKLPWDEFKAKYEAGAELDVSYDGEKITYSHEKKLGTSYTTNVPTDKSATAFGDSVTIKVPKLTANEYGHITAAEDTEYTITLPTPEAATNTVTTLTEGPGIDITDTATDGNHNYKVSANIGTGLKFEGTTDADKKIAHQDAPATGNAAEVKTGGTGRTYVTEVLVDDMGHIAGVKTATETVTDTDTHHEAKNVVGASATAKANATATNGNVHLNLIENDTVRSHHNIKGEGTVAVTSDANGNIIITGTDTNVNTAHTHAVGDGLKQSSTGGISGEVKTELNLKFGELKDNKLQLLDATNNAVIAEFNASDFVKDSYLKSASFDPDTNILTFTFIDNEDKLEAIPVDLTDLVDVYTADGTSLIKTDAQFSIKDSGVSTAKIADDAVTADKLADTINTDIAKGVTAYGWGDHSKEGYVKTDTKYDLIAGPGGSNYNGAESGNDNTFLTLYHESDHSADTSVQVKGKDGLEVATELLGDVNEGDTHYGVTVKIADSGVTTAKIANKAVTEDKLADAVQTKLNSALQNATGNVDITPVVDGTKLKFYEIGLSKDGTSAKIGKLAADNSVDLAGIKVNNAVKADTVADHAIGAHQTKACADYTGEDAEVWVLNCNW